MLGMTPSVKLLYLFRLVPAVAMPRQDISAKKSSLGDFAVVVLSTAGDREQFRERKIFAHAVDFGLSR